MPVSASTTRSVRSTGCSVMVLPMSTVRCGRSTSSVESVPGARHAGVTVLDAAGTLTTLGPTDSVATVHDEIQREVQEGPCLSAAWTQHTILIDDLTALNFYAESPRVFDDDSVEMGLIFAAHTTLAWNMLRREQQFQSALAGRDIIGQAKGMLMERFDIDAVAAFNLLRRLSQDSNVRISEIARRVVAAGRGEP